MKIYLFKPYDVIGFGGLKNFSAGETHIQKSIFPPPIMRFFHIFNSVYGVFLYKDGNLFLPVPSDCLVKRKEESGKAKISPLEFPPLIRGDLEAYERANGFISFSDLMNKYAKNIDGFKIYLLEEFLKKESRVGITLDKERRVVRSIKEINRKEEKGLLYSQDFFRFNDGVKLAVLGEINKDIVISGKQYFRLGGEGKIVSFKHTEHINSFLEGKIKIKNGNYYKFYCLTHAYINNGIIESKIQTICIEGINFEVEWLYNGGVEYVSGYNKPFLEMLRPGSVLILKAKNEGEIQRLNQISTNVPISNIKNFLNRGWNSGIIVEGVK
ncbi:type III-B CRISPR module-associated protein Cmr3 [Aquifex aeolicus]|uniref:CRISPR-associated protein Cmr3 n=1 Tax=Aquifex aeolicus (strain VF5) TaxID=224324 RepID=O66707_AQUAE|nr:type III-B CRISPR module-associated protein Cmr3 [Aquifex aeolicus]AAC06667.1 putative protein [Aquifex aeolicus VF5]